MSQSNLQAPPPRPALSRQVWPVQAQCDSFYGPNGGDAGPSNVWELRNLCCVIPPWRMIDDDTNQPVWYFLIHKRCLPSLSRILLNIWYGYNFDQAVIEAHKLHRFAGSYVYRHMRHGSHLSMHSYGCALDIAGNANAQGTEGEMSPIAVAAFEAEGWVWGGRWHGESKDAMHFQAARLA
jgi:hypothetical protein